MTSPDNKFSGDHLHSQLISDDSSEEERPRPIVINNSSEEEEKRCRHVYIRGEKRGQRCDSFKGLNRAGLCRLHRRKEISPSNLGVRAALQSDFIDNEGQFTMETSGRLRESLYNKNLSDADSEEIERRDINRRILSTREAPSRDEVLELAIKILRAKLFPVESASSTPEIRRTIKELHKPGPQTEQEEEHIPEPEPATSHFRAVRSIYEIIQLYIILPMLAFVVFFFTFKNQIMKYFE